MLLCIFFVSRSADKRKDVPGQSRRPSTVTGVPHSTLLNINNISMWASDNGLTERNPNDLTAGVSFPKGTGTVIHAGGFVWGGQVHDGANPMVRIGGQTYNQGTVAGRIVSPGIVENPDNADIRIFRIRRDWATADLTSDASQIFGIPEADITSADIQRLRAMYQTDWMEWPWEKGAPYYERNGIPGYQPNPNGIIDSTSDEPGLGSADQVIWFVTNDLDAGATASLYGSPPIGLEDQVTYWSYNSSKLQNIIFQRHRLIYKGTATTSSSSYIDSMYIGKWADPDVGDYSDDEVGYLADRQVEYAYNSTPHDAIYDQFNMVPPVVGYDFLQGPRVIHAGVTANWNLSSVNGYENLPVNTFTYFTPTNRPTDYQLGSGAGAWYNILRGDNPYPISPPQCMINFVTQQCTQFALTGDPQLYEGWIDGLQEPPQDRRFVMASGPFRMAFGDTQEVVVGLLAAMGTDNREGITVLKTVADAAQDSWRLNFNFPLTVPPPDVRVVELDDKLILDWESDTAQTRNSEGYSSRGYRFESYKIYQFPLPTDSVQQALVYQIVDPSQPRYVYITDDKLRNHSLVDGQKYYFAVTTVAYNPDQDISTQRIESPAIIHECVPHSPNPGTIYPYQINETVSNVQNIIGYNDASVTVTYFDPSRPDGHYYDVLFLRSSDPLREVDQKPQWDLIDSTEHDTLIQGAFTDSPPTRVIRHGFTIQVQTPVFGIRGVYQTLYKNKPTSDFVFNVPNPEQNYMVLAAGSSDIDTIQGYCYDDINVELRFNGDSSWALFRGSNVPHSRWVRVPYTAWRVGLVGRDTINSQVYTSITHAGLDSIWRPTVLLNRAYNGKTIKVFYPITVMIDSLLFNNNWYGGEYYDDVPTRADAPIYKAIVFENSFPYGSLSSVVEAYIADLDNDGIAAPKGTTIRFVRWKEVKNGDEKLFTPIALTTSNLNAAKLEMDRINVFPNPYYGYNRSEISSSQKFVTFNHLPQVATIRIFNLAGDIVRVIRKDDDTQFATWDLNNETGLQAAGGIYLAHIVLQDKSGADLGTKILKLMIVPENQTPRN